MRIPSGGSKCPYCHEEFSSIIDDLCEPLLRERPDNRISKLIESISMFLLCSAGWAFISWVLPAALDGLVEGSLFTNHSNKFFWFYFLSPYIIYFLQLIKRNTLTHDKLITKIQITICGILIATFGIIIYPT